MDLITANQAITTLREVVAEFGRDYMYEVPKGCSFCRCVHKNKPSCLVGQVLVRRGVPMSTLAQYEGLSADQLGKQGVNLGDSATLRGLPYLVTPEAGRVLAAAQGAQDMGLPWGRALDDAQVAYRDILAEAALAA